MASTLGRALESVCTSGADEVIVVDDASEDGTKDVVDGYAKRHDFVRYIRHPEKAADHNAAQRDIWMGVKSDQIVGLAADDWLYPGAIEGMKSCADSPAVFTDMDIFHEDGSYLYSMFHNFYGRKSPAEIRLRMATYYGAGETGFACAVRTDMAKWLWNAGWERLGPMMDTIGLAAVATLFGASYLSVQGGAFTMPPNGSYGLNLSRTAEEYYALGTTAVAWLFSVGVDSRTIRAIAGSRCCLNKEALESIT